MRSVLVAILALFIVGCSSVPSNKELAADVDSIKATMRVNTMGITQNKANIKKNEVETDEKIDRAFKKSQLK